MKLYINQLYIMKSLNYIAESIDSLIDSFSAPIYNLLILILYVTYIIAIIGVTYINPEYTRYLTVFIQSFIAIILMVRFNPLRSKVQFTDNDRTFVFSAAFYLLLNDEFTQYIIDYMKQKIIPMNI
jgi:hypothetical protein